MAALCFTMKSATIKNSPFAEVNGNLKIRDSIIPKEISDFLILNRSRHITVAEEGGNLWVASKHKAKHIKLDEYKEFEICYMKPAKGSGFIAIQAWPQKKGKGCASIIEFGIYTDQTLDSAIEVADQLKSVLGYSLSENYWGADC